MRLVGVDLPEPRQRDRADLLSHRPSHHRTREFHQAMTPWSEGLVYVNALAQDDSARVREAYGRNYDRLARVKRRYDPENRFRRNQNIVPA